MSKINIYLNVFAKSIIAGIFIGMAGIVSAQYEHSELIFPIGLICIILSNGLLYTGCIGHYNLKDKKWFLLCILFGNFIGVYLTLFYARTLDFNLFVNIIKYKETLIFSKCFISSIFCGMLMCAATSLNERKNILVIIICVAAFIIGKFDHCIADMFYLGIDGYNFLDFLIITTSIIGNTVGAKILYKVKGVSNEICKN